MGKGEGGQQAILLGTTWEESEVGKRGYGDGPSVGSCQAYLSSDARQG
jgi:hypothetical protein